MHDRLAADLMIAAKDLDLVRATDDPDEAVELIRSGAARQGMAA
jgi:hypothetical protein